MKFRKIWGCVVYIFIITFLFFSCMSLKTHNPEPENIYQQTRSLTIKEKYKEGGENFVFLLKEMSSTITDDCERLPGLCQPFVGSTASGIVLSTDDSSLVVLTAAHFCVSREEDFMFREKIIGFAADAPRELSILGLDVENDLCLLQGAKYIGEKFKDIKIAEKTTIGEEVYTVAAPLGIASPGIRMIFEGTLGGCHPENCLTTIPATFGSSGAGIMNKKGELITIIMAVPEEFDHVIISPSNEKLTKFIRDIDKSVDIYPY